MREKQDDRALVRQLADRRHRRLDPRRVADRAFEHRDVEVDAHEHALAGDVTDIVEGFERGHFSHSVPGACPCEGRGPSPKLSVSRSEEHTSALQSLMRISYSVFGLIKKHSTKPNK